GSEDKFQPARHLKPAMREIAMQIKGRAESNPKINAEHDRQGVKLKASPDSRDPECLQHDEDRENSDIEFFVLEHSGGEQTAAARRRRSQCRREAGPRQAIFIRTHPETDTKASRATGNAAWFFKSSPGWIPGCRARFDMFDIPSTT